MNEITNFLVKILEILLLSFGCEARARGVKSKTLSKFPIQILNPSLQFEGDCDPSCFTSSTESIDFPLVSLLRVVFPNPKSKRKKK